MKTRYKLAVCAMAAIMAFSITAYADGSDPKEVYNAAVKKSGDLKYLDSYSYMAVTASDGQQVESSGVTQTLKLKLAGPSETQYLAVLAASSNGVPNNTDTFIYHNGTYYMNLNDQATMKYDMNIDTFLGAAQETLSNIAPSFYDPDWNSDIAMRTEDGNTIITFNIVPKETDNYLDEILADNGGINGEYTINSDGYFTDIKLYGTFNTDLFDDPLLLAYIYENKVNNPGQPFNIEFPDTSGYEDISAQVAGNGPSDDDSWIYSSQQYGPAEEAELKALFQNDDTSDNQDEA